MAKSLQLFYRIKQSSLPDNDEFVVMGKYLYEMSSKSRDEKRDKLYKYSKAIFLNLENEKNNRIPHHITSYMAHTLR